MGQEADEQGADGVHQEVALPTPPTTLIQLRQGSARCVTDPDEEVSTQLAANMAFEPAETRRPIVLPDLSALLALATRATSKRTGLRQCLFGRPESHCGSV